MTAQKSTVFIWKQFRHFEIWWDAMTYDIFWHLARLPRTRTGIQGKKAQRWLDLMSWRDLETRLANGWIDRTEVLSICLCILRFGFVGLCGSHCKASVGRQTAEAKRWAHIEFEASKRLKSLSDLDVEFKWVMQMNANVNVFQDSKMFQVFQNFKTQFTVALPLMEFEIEVKVSSQKPNPVGWHFALHSIEELQSSRQGQRHRLRTSVRFRLHSLDILRVPQLQICRPAAWKDSGDCAETRYRGRCAFAMIYDSDRLIGHIGVCSVLCTGFRFKTMPRSSTALTLLASASPVLLLELDKLQLYETVQKQRQQTFCIQIIHMNHSAFPDQWLPEVSVDLRSLGIGEEVLQGTSEPVGTKREAGRCNSEGELSNILHMSKLGWFSWFRCLPKKSAAMFLLVLLRHISCRETMGSLFTLHFLPLWG